MPRGLSFVFLFQSIRANTVVGRVQVGTREGMAFDGAYIWVANEKGRSVSKIDPIGNTLVGRVGVGSKIGKPLGVAFDGAHIWVTNYSSNDVSKIDLSTSPSTVPKTCTS